jgi:uncharacterized protein (DUF1697 family)
MMTHVAFLRAINVGGTGLVKMADLQQAFTAAGCRNVRTFIASGNVVFDAPDGLEPLRPRILKKVGALLGAEPAIMFRTIRDLEAIVKTAPFGTLVHDRAVKLYVAFLAGKPARKVVYPLALPKEALEAIGMKKSDVLIVSRQKPNGWYGFPANWLEKELGVPSTARSWSTVTKVVEFAKRGAPQTGAPRMRT